MTAKECILSIPFDEMVERQMTLDYSILGQEMRIDMAYTWPGAIK